MAFRPMNGVDMANQKVTNLADPSASTDAANKNYVDNVASGLTWKQPVRVATTANGALTTAYANGQTIDGVALTTGMRILIKDQTTGSENGIYTVNATGAPTRATDADSTAELQSATVYVVAGTTNADKAFTQTANDPVVGTTALVWAQVGGGTTYTAGNGINISGTTVTAVAAASGGVTVGVGGIAIDTTLVPRKFAANNPGATGGTAQTITHNLNTLDVDVTVVEVSTGQDVAPDVLRNGVNTVTVTFPTTTTAGQYRVVVMG